MVVVKDGVGDFCLTVRTEAPTPVKLIIFYSRLGILVNCPRTGNRQQGLYADALGTRAKTWQLKSSSRNQPTKFFWAAKTRNCHVSLGTCR